MNMNAHEYDYQCTVCLHKDIQESHNVKQHEKPNHPKNSELLDWLEPISPSPYPG